MKAMNKTNGNSQALRMAALLLLFFLFLGVLFSILYGILRVGASPETVSTYYNGSKAALAYPKELPELMASTHIHLFMIPLIFYVLCHLFAQTPLPAAWKAAVIGLTYVNITGFLAAPYLVRFVSPGFALFFPLHEGLFVITAAILVYFPIREILHRRHTNTTTSHEETFR